MGAGNPAPLAALDVHDTGELGSRTAYAARRPTPIASCSTAKVAIEELGVQQDALQKAPTRRTSAISSTPRSEITQATTEQQQLLDQANGKISSLVAEVRAERERDRKPPRKRDGAPDAGTPRSCSRANDHEQQRWVEQFG
jgi:hypothetical protein